MIGKEFIIACKETYSFLENEMGFIIHEIHAEKDGKSDWITYINETRAIKINYDWHDEYLFVIIYKIEKQNSILLPYLGDSENVLNIENLISIKDYNKTVSFHATMNNYKSVLSESSKVLTEIGIDILSGEKWISNEQVLSGNSNS